MFFLFFSFPTKNFQRQPRTVSVHLHYTEIQRTLFEKFGKFLFCIRAKSNSLFLKITTDGIFCLSFAIWVLATSYTWKNLSRLCQFKIWLVPKRYKKTAGTDVTGCLTGCHWVEPRYLGYLWAPMDRHTCQSCHIGKSSDLRLPHIWFYVYHVICNCF